MCYETGDKTDYPWYLHLFKARKHKILHSASWIFFTSISLVFYRSSWNKLTNYFKGFDCTISHWPHQIKNTCLWFIVRKHVIYLWKYVVNNLPIISYLNFREELDVLYQVETRNISSSYKCQKVSDLKLKVTSAKTSSLDSDSSLPDPSIPDHSIDSPPSPCTTLKPSKTTTREDNEVPGNLVAPEQKTTLMRTWDWCRPEKLPKNCEKVKKVKKSKRKRKRKSEKNDTKTLIKENEKMKNNILKYLVKNKRKMLDDDSSSSFSSSSN